MDDKVPPYATAEWRAIFDARQRIRNLETAVRAITQQIDAVMEHFEVRALTNTKDMERG